MKKISHDWQWFLVCLVFGALIRWTQKVLQWSAAKSSSSSQDPEKYKEKGKNSQNTEDFV